MADGFCGVAADDGIGGHIFSDDSTWSDDRIVADGDAGIDDGAAADPDIVADGDRLAEFFAGIADRRIERMAGRVDMNTGGNHAIVADPDFADVQKYTIEIGIEIFADMDVETVIAADGRFSMKDFADWAE